MLTTRHTKFLRLLVAAAVLALGLAFVGQAQAQQYWVQQPVTTWGWHPASVQYQPVRTIHWHWTPELGWHRHDQYVYVPHAVPGHWAPVAVQNMVVEYR